jgi:cobalt ECF transporter T component CbiQ
MNINAASKPTIKRTGILEHTIGGITATLERAFFAEEISTRKGLFQSLDARVKVLSVLVLLISVGLSHSLMVIALIYLLVFLLAWASAIPASVLIKRVWLALPFFTGVIVLPALFITPGPTLFQILPSLVVTRTGVITVLFLLLRVSTSVSLTLLLILTTPWSTVLSALSVLRVPDVFILILGMTYRYIYLLLHIANDMFLSRKSRVVGRLSTAENQKMLAAVSGTLLGKSLNMSSEVFMAMQSRGFRGTVITLKPFQMQSKDRLWAIVFAAIAALAIYVGR